MFLGMMKHDPMFRQRVETYLERNSMSARKFGVAVLDNPGFVHTLRRGSSPRLNTADKVMLFMGAEPMRAHFLRRVELFFATTPILPTALGEEIVGNSSFVWRLHRGLSPRLITLDQICQWMQDVATREEWTMIEGAMLRTDSDGSSSSQGGLL